MNSETKVPVALLFSFTQNAYHIEDVLSVCKSGLDAVMLNEPTDWIVVHIVSSHEQASQLAEQLPRPTPFPRELVKAVGREFDRRRERLHAGQLTGEQWKVLKRRLRRKTGTDAA